MRRKNWNAATVWIVAIFVFVAATMSALLIMVYSYIEDGERRRAMEEQAGALASNADAQIVSLVEAQISSSLAARDPGGELVAQIARAFSPSAPSIMRLAGIMADVKASASIVNCVELYFPANRVIVGSAGVRYLDDRKNGALRAEYASISQGDFSRPAWLRAFRRTVEGAAEYLAYAREYAYGQSADGRFPVLVVYLSDDNVQKALRRSLRALDGETRVLVCATDGRILSAPDSAWIGESLPAAEKAGDAVALANGERARAAEAASSNGLWYYALLAPPGGNFQDFQSVFALWLGACLALLLIGLACVLYILFRHYLRPLRRLMRKIDIPEPSARGPVLQSPQAHFSLIESALEDRNEEFAAGESFIEEARPILMENWLNRFAAGEAAYTAPIERLGIAFPHPRFQALILYGPDAREARALAARAYPEERAAVYAFVTPRKETALLVNHALSGEEADAAIQTLLTLSPACRAAVGEIANSPEDARGSFQSARAAASDMFFHKGARLYRAGSASDSRSAASQQLAARLRALVTGVSGKDEARIAGEIDEILRETEALRPSVGAMQNAMMAAAVSLMKPLYDLKIEPSEVFGEELVGAYYHIADAEALRERLITDIARLKERLGSVDSENNRSVVKYAVHCIRTAPPALLSIQYVSDALSISPSYLSRLFHQETGQKFVDYLQDVKMECACRLLREGGRTLDEICAEIGYAKTQYFAGKFRERYGMTPRQYADAHAGE